MVDKQKSEMWYSTCRSGTHNDRSCRRQKWGGGRVTDKANRVTEEEVEHSFVFAMYTGTNESKVGKPNLLLVDCGATSHIITDKSKFTRFDSTLDPSKHYIELANGAKANNVALMRGDCNTCILGKFADSRSRKPDAKAKVPLALVHTDLLGQFYPFLMMVLNTVLLLLMTFQVQ